MKKLKELKMGSKDLLTRDQMRQISGGLTQPCGSGEFTCTCTNSSGSYLICAFSVIDCQARCPSGGHPI
jgi:hypothetical protein